MLGWPTLSRGSIYQRQQSIHETRAHSCREPESAHNSAARFPRSAIKRFANDVGEVQVQRFLDERHFPATPANKIFCAQRVWDQKTETVRSHEIETRYAELTSEISACHIITLTGELDCVVNAFYALWNRRHMARKSPSGDVALRGVLPGEPLTKAREETLERNGDIFARGNVVPSRMRTVTSIQVQMNRFLRANQGTHWGIVHADFGQFLVADNALGLGIIPVSPNICLCQDSNDLNVGPDCVGLINRLTIERGDSYYFARDLDRCPIFRRTMPHSITDAEGRPNPPNLGRAW